MAQKLQLAPPYEIKHISELRVHNAVNHKHAGQYGKDLNIKNRLHHDHHNKNYIDNSLSTSEKIKEPKPLKLHKPSTITNFGTDHQFIFCYSCGLDAPFRHYQSHRSLLHAIHVIISHAHNLLLNLTTSLRLTSLRTCTMHCSLKFCKCCYPITFQQSDHGHFVPLAT